MRYLEKLKARYLEEIKAAIDFENLDFELTTDEDGFVVENNWLGAITAITPSGKIYMPWSTNVTRREALRDRVFAEALEEVADREALTVTEFSGDLFLTRYIGDTAEIATTHDGEIFHYCGKRYTAEELDKVAELEGFFPTRILTNERDDILGYA